MIDAETKIAVNPVRILRSFRFAAELGFTIEEKTFNALVKNVYLLKDSITLDDDIWQILSLDHDTKVQILESLRKYGFNCYITYPDNIYKTVNTLAIETNIYRYPQIREVA